MDYYLNVEVLYKRSSDETLLRCLDERKAKKMLQEAHERICDSHIIGYMMARQIQRSRYF